MFVHLILVGRKIVGANKLWHILCGEHKWASGLNLPKINTSPILPKICVHSYKNTMFSRFGAELQIFSRFYNLGLGSQIYILGTQGLATCDGDQKMLNISYTCTYKPHFMQSCIGPKIVGNMLVRGQWCQCIKLNAVPTRCPPFQNAFNLTLI